MFRTNGACGVTTNPCDYVKHRTAENAKPCGKCGDPAWDICYDAFLCDACAAAFDAEMNEHIEKLRAVACAEVRQQEMSGMPRKEVA